MRNKKIIISAVLMGIALGFLCPLMITYYPPGSFEEVKTRVSSKENKISAVVKLSKNGPYLLRIKFKTEGKQDFDVFFNESSVNPNTFSYIVKNGNKKSIYILIPEEKIRLGENSVDLVTSGNSDVKATITLRNFRKKIDDRFFIVFSGNLYKIGVTGQFYKELFFLILVALLVFIGHSKTQELFFNTTQFCFSEREFNIWEVLGGFFLLVIVSLVVCWPSFFHLFRHDEWFLFFSSKDAPADFTFVIKHLDWQLKLPYDRLIFRPLHHGSLALNRVVFDTNYIGPHILTFGKHLIACFCLWWLMWECKKKWISFLFALLFSVLVINIDAVAWPHVDGYILTTIFTLLAIITFRKAAYNQISPAKGFLATGLLLFLNILTTEIAFLMPIVFFILYWLVFRNHDEIILKSRDKASFLILFVPTVIWAVLFSIHLYLAYPDLKMTSQSGDIGLLAPFINVIRLTIAVFAAIVLPTSKINYEDKLYFSNALANFIILLLAVVFFIRCRRKKFEKFSKEIIFVSGLFFSILLILCFARASYVNSLLNSNETASHYTYCLSALALLLLYLYCDFDKLFSNKRIRTLFVIILCFLIAYHSFQTFSVCCKIEDRTRPLKKYFDLVRDFVGSHRKEPDFSFKIIDRPPKIKVFPWYHQTCIDGLFNRFINNKNPKYILEYDYELQKVSYSTCDRTPRLTQTTYFSRNTQRKPDFVNSMGIKLKKISLGEKEFLIGMFEVSQKQWQEIMGYNPSRFINDDHPVENVSYYMAQQFIRRLNDIEESCFYRLPSEEEYNSLTNWLSESNIEKYGWFKYNSGQRTHAVGTMESCVEGVYDLVGNVWEWTETPIHPGSPADKFEGNPRICFGGSWRDTKINYENLTTNYPPDFRHEHLGFRLVCEVKDEDKKEK